MYYHKSLPINYYHIICVKYIIKSAICLFQLLLRTELVGVTTLALTAVSSTRGQAGVALTADSLLAVVLGSKSLERGLNDGGTTTKAEDQMEGRLLLDVVIAEGAAVVELLTGEDKTLLVRRNALLVRDLALHGIDGVAGLNLEGNSLTGQCLDENLHLIQLTQSPFDG